MPNSGPSSALTFNSPGERVCILSDSEITVRGLNEWRYGWKARGWRKANGKPVANADLWRRLDALADAADRYVTSSIGSEVMPVSH
ncbi:Ribonuclease HI [bacterium YEK0313]|nr:Ribonuclease HI [bacterium YEK0313]